MSRSRKNSGKSSGLDSDPTDNGETRQLKSFSDRLIADQTPELAGPEVLVILLHGTRLASVLREQRPDLNFTFYTPEHFFYRTLTQYNAPSAGNSLGAGRVILVCDADLPSGEFQEVLFPTLAGDSSEQAQELLQSAHQRLIAGGRLIVSTNNPADRWIQAQLRSLCSSVSVNKQKHGVVCAGIKTGPLKKPRGFRARAAFRLGDRLIFCESRPGVFSHRRIDGGARALIKALTQWNASKTFEGDSRSSTGSDKGIGGVQKIVDMGCGSGAVSMAAAVLFPAAEVLAVDSDARAVECTQMSAGLNGLNNVRALLTSDGKVPDPGTWDLLLGNPPYYSDYRIAELFLQTARTSLRPGGKVLLVTKLTEWHEARMKQLFRNVRLDQFGDYTVFTGVQGGNS